MASKLYPPILEASIPAFYGNTIVIPFKHNPLVSSKDYKDFAVQIKKINGDIVEGSPFIVSKEGLVDNQIVLNINTNFVQSNWYKIQIAYKSSIIGYYSTAAVAKYLGTNRPTVSLRFANGAYIGTYNHEDASEKAYSYQFVLTDSFGNIIEDTGEKIHNVNDDTEENSSSDIFYFKYNLKEEDNKYYSLEYILTTINGIVLKAKTQITKGILDGFEQDQLFKVDARVNRDQGSVEIWAQGLITPVTGSFILRKICSKDDYLRIQSVTCFDLTKQDMAEEKDGQLVPLSIKLCEDLTCEAGYYYKYYIQQYNKYSVFSKPVGESSTIYVSFDDCFLYDGEKQLKILYNPKVSSFKENILQSKSETIGSKYPFITRNSIVGYKEFPISGLISFQTDDNQKFMNLKDQIRLGIVPDSVQRETTHSEGEEREDITYPQKRYFHKNLERKNNINLVDLNINAEKEFKLQVLDFLNSKTPKLFRSATEGNYYVYTMNSSLTPNDVVGRMLHTFNCTAYEIGPVQDFYDGLIGKDFEGLYNTDGNLVSRTELNKFYTKTLSILNTDNQVNYNLLMDNELARNFYIRDADPLSNYTISFIDKNNTNRIIENQIITIGATGSYNYFCVEPNVYIKGVWIGRLNEDGERINISKYTGITFRNMIRIPLSDFDFISGVNEESSLAMQLAKKDREKILQYYYQVLNELKKLINIAKKEDYSTVLTDLLNVKENFQRVWSQDDYGVNIVSQILYGEDIDFSNSLRTLSGDVYFIKDINSEYYEETIALIELIRMDGDFVLELTPASEEVQTALISNIYNYDAKEKTITTLDNILLLRARNFNERYAEQAVFNLDNYYSIIQELNYLEQKPLGAEIYFSKELNDFLNNNSFTNYIINKILLSTEQKNEYDNKNLREHEEFSFNVSYAGKKNNSFVVPILAAKTLQSQNKQVVTIPPSTTKILAINIQNPSNFYYYGTTGDNIYYDISCQMEKTTYQFEL